MILRIAGHRGRCIICKEPLLRTYRLASRNRTELVAASELVAHLEKTHPGKKIVSALLLRSDFVRTRAIYGELSSEETFMEAAIGEAAFLMVLTRSDRKLFLHEAMRARYLLDLEFRRWVMERILRAPDYDVLSFAIIQRGYELNELYEEIACHVVGEFFGASWMLLTGNQPLAEELRGGIFDYNAGNGFPICDKPEYN